MLQHEVPLKPWSELAANLYQVDDAKWLILCDDYSKFPVERWLPDPCPSCIVIQCLQEGRRPSGKMTWSKGKKEDRTGLKHTAWGLQCQCHQDLQEKRCQGELGNSQPWWKTTPFASENSLLWGKGWLVEGENGDLSCSKDTVKILGFSLS